MNQRPRVTHIIDTSLPGGAQMQLTNLMRGSRQDFDFSVVVLGRSGEFTETWQDLGARVVNLGEAGSRWGLAGWGPLLRWLKQERPDLVHTHLFKSNILGAMAAHKVDIPCILHDHSGLDRQGMAFYFPNLLVRALYALAYRRSLTGCRRLLVLTESMRQAYITEMHLDPGRISVLPNCLDMKGFQALAGKPATDIRMELGLSRETRLVSMVGRLAPEKDWSTFLQLARLNPGLAFLAVGEGALEESLRDQAQLSGISNLLFLGLRRDVPALLAQSDAFLLTSRQEAFGIVLLEAMAAGCPVIATRTRGAEALLQDEVNGLLVPVGDVQACQAALTRVIRDGSLVQKMKQAALQSLAAFDLGSVCDRLTTLYQEVLAEGN